MSRFVFVHGAWHGAWCWSRLLPEMQARGHRSVTMDLPVDDANATFADYADIVLASYPAAVEDVVLVGHSLGAMVIPLVAASRPSSRLVFLCGSSPMSTVGRGTVLHPMGRPGAYQTETLDDGSSVFATFESARFTFYADCDLQDASWAFGRLRPQNSTSLWDRPYPLRQLPETPRVAIAALDDTAMTIEFSRAVTRPRLGVEPIEIPGGHSPFVARPAELADLLDQLAPATSNEQAASERQ
jgi:pimeloyl-ACP methyl ester carboxylesterase